MSIVAETLELAERLLALVEDETARLTAYQPADAELATEKQALADALADAQERLKAAGRVALLAEPASLRAALKARLADLSLALADNARLIARRRDLGEGLIASILAEARRLSGANVPTYAPGASAVQRAAPLAFNAEV